MLLYINITICNFKFIIFILNINDYANLLLLLQAAFGKIQYAAISYIKQGISYNWERCVAQIHIENVTLQTKK